MPSLSTTVTKVLEVCNSPTASPNDLNRVISLDPVLTGQLLTLINSAYYGLANRIASLTRAIIMLGVNTVKNMVLVTSVLGGIPTTVARRSAIDQFWAHCLGVGVTARAIAQLRAVPAVDQEEFFVGGLLHDLGKLPIMACFPNDYEQAVGQAARDQVPLSKVEIERLGFDHCTVGRLIVAKWRLSAGIADAVVRHFGPEAPEAESSLLLDAIRLANQAAHRFQFAGAASMVYERELALELAQRCKIDLEELLSLKVFIEEDIQKARIFLQVAKG